MNHLRQIARSSRWLVLIACVVGLSACSDDGVDSCDADEDCDPGYRCGADGECQQRSENDFDFDVDVDFDVDEEFNFGVPNDVEMPEMDVDIDDGDRVKSPDMGELEAAEDEHDFQLVRTCDPSGMFSCDPGEDPQPVHWFEYEIGYEIHEQGSSDLHSGDMITDTVRDAVISTFDSWTDPGCTDLVLAFEGLTDNDEIGYSAGADGDGSPNIVVWRDEQWPHAGFDGIALTTLTFNTTTGRVVSADVEVNTAEYQFTNSDDDVVFDLRNTMAHEVGHFIGFDHSTHEDATMYGTAPVGEISKRELHDVDLAGVCHVYPTRQ